MTSRPAVFPRRRFLAQWLGLGLLLLLVGGYMLTSLQASYQAIETSERERLEKQGAVVSKNLAPLIFSANRAIEGILEDLPRWRSVQDGNQLANRRLEVISDTLPGIRNLLITNAGGRVVSSNRPETVGLDLSQRDHFQAARQDPNPRTLFVTQPFRSLINTYVMVLVRVIPGPNGEFNGIVIASIDPEYFRTLLDSVLYAQDMFTYVAHGDGKLFLVSPEFKNAAGKDLAEAGSVFRRYVDSRAPAGLLIGDPRIATGEHMIALRTVQPPDLFMNKPLVLAVARQTDAIFVDWRKDARHEAWIFAVVLMVSSAALFSLQRRRLILDRIRAERDVEQARFTTALTESETRYRSLVENTQDPITRIDAQGRFAFVNSAAGSVFGLAPGECIGLSAFEFVHPDDREATQAAFARWLENQSSRLSFENRQVSRSGDVRLLQWNISADHNAAGEVIGFGGVARDITQMRQAELEIRQGRNDLAKAVALLELTGRIARVGGWSLDLETRKLEWTRQTYQIHELEPSEPVDLDRAIVFFCVWSSPLDAHRDRRVHRHGARL